MSSESNCNNKQPAHSAPDIIYKVLPSFELFNVYVCVFKIKPFIQKLPHLFQFAVCFLLKHAVTLGSHLAHPSCESL